MNISVIIPSFNGEKRLPVIIESILNQSLPPDEVIVVLDGSSDASNDILLPFVESLNLIIIKQANLGRAGARNTGATAANGELLIFYDDDMNPDQDSVKRHYEIQLYYDGCLCSGQQIEPESSSSEFSKYKARLDNKWVSHLKEGHKELGKEDLYMTAANMSCKKSSFDSLGGFDSTLRDNEDYDLAARGFLQSIPVVFDPKNLAFHKSFDSFLEYLIRQREYKMSYSRLLEKKRGCEYFDLYSKFVPSTSSFKKALYFFVPGWIIHVIDSGFFKLLPEKWRFTIYERVIAALSVYYPNRKV